MSGSFIAKLIPYRWLIAGLLILIISAVVSQQASANGLYRSSREATSGAPHVLRRDESYGQNTVLRLRVYTGFIGATGPRPANNTGPSLVIDQTRCDNSGNGNRVTISNATVSGNQCRIMPRSAFINGGVWTYDPDIGRSYKDVTFVLDADGGQRRDGYVFEFHINIVSDNGYAPQYFLGYARNISPNGWAVNDRNRVQTYNIDFAPNPCGPDDSLARVGMYDPEDRLMVRLFDGPRGGGPASNLLAQVRTEGGDDGEQGLFSIDFNPSPNRKYRLQVEARRDNDTMSLYWPYDTVYATAGRCYTVITHSEAVSFFRLTDGDVYTDGNLRAFTPSATSLAAFVNSSIDRFRTKNSSSAPGPLTFSNTSGGTYGWGGNFDSSHTYSLPASFWNPPRATRVTGPATYDQARCDSDGLIYVNGNVTITGNVQLNPLNPTFAQIRPCGVIATGNVYINPGVTTLYGTYAAQRNLYDCAPSSSPGTGYVINNCRNRLTVRGALLSNLRLYLLRVHPDTNGYQGEDITFGPETWLQSIAGTTSPDPSSGYEAVTSLPPIL